MTAPSPRIITGSTRLTRRETAISASYSKLSAVFFNITSSFPVSSPVRTMRASLRSSPSTSLMARLRASPF